MTLVAVLVLTCVLSSTAGNDSALYSQSYGDSTKPAMIFLHGGPGYNSANFELTTASVLAQRGYFVIVFDQRGCGRSKDMNDNLFTLDEALDDLQSIYKRYGINTATLIGHSWGGTLGSFFAERNPEMVGNLILVGSPLSYQLTLRTILQRCRTLYSANKDSINLDYIAAIERMDTASLPYSSYLFFHAMNSGLYTPKNPSAEMQAIYSKLAMHPQANLLTQSELAPVQGLHTNESYTTLDMSAVFAACIRNGVVLWGIYGVEDGLFTTQHLDMIAEVISEEHMVLIRDASHNVFIDQQQMFIDTLEKIVPTN